MAANSREQLELVVKIVLIGLPVDIAVDELLMTDCAGDRGAIDSMLSPGGR